MSQNTTLTLRVYLDGAPSYEIGDEIWQVGLAEAIAEQADCVADVADAVLLVEPTAVGRDRLRDRVIRGMTAALVAPGDAYTAPDGVRYKLI